MCSMLSSVRAYRLYQHLNDPARALVEARRVLAPGGRIVLVDQDYDMWAIDADDEMPTCALMRAQSDAITNRWMGRHYHNFLLNAGFVEDCPDLPLAPTGPRARVIVATYPATSTMAPVGSTRSEVVYELFYTALPQNALSPADIVSLYLYRGAFECVLSDEDHEQAASRWCSHTPWGQEFWLICSQWLWNLRLELGHALHPTPLRTTHFAPAEAAPDPVSRPSEPTPVNY